MKTVACIVLLFVAMGCQKEKSDKKAEAKGKLQGKWQVTRQEDEIWQPVNLLYHAQDNPVFAGDSVIFTDNEIYGYADTQSGVQEEVYPLIFANDSTLIIDEEPYLIKKLTERELVLYHEDLDLAEDRKDVTRTTMVR